MSYLDSVIELETELIVFIGRNGSGKSFRLNKLLEMYPDESVYISEEGIANVLNQRNNIEIDYQRNMYLYNDEQNRGQDQVSEEYTIQEQAMVIVEYCSEIKSKLTQIINKSQGQKKLENIMDIFLGYNLNNIKTILFDEPENFLDEEYLRIISKLINKLISLGFKVRLSTHNSSLLSILSVDINDIILCENRRMFHVTRDHIRELFVGISEAIEEIRVEEKINQDSSIDFKLNIHNVRDVYNNYIDSNLRSVDFYSCLFHKTILIVEGISDEEALKSIKEKFENTVCIYSANGKAWIPFYTKLFQSFGKEIVALIDVDNVSKTHASLLTEILRKCEGLKLLEHNPDMESEYGIDIDQIGISFGMSRNVRRNNKGWLKQLSAYHFFNVQGNWPLLEEKIFPQEEGVYSFD